MCTYYVSQICTKHNMINKINEVHAELQIQVSYKIINYFIQFFTVINSVYNQSSHRRLHSQVSWGCRWVRAGNRQG